MTQKYLVESFSIEVNMAEHYATNTKMEGNDLMNFCFRLGKAQAYYLECNCDKMNDKLFDEYSAIVTRYSQLRKTYFK